MYLRCKDLEVTFSPQKGKFTLTLTLAGHNDIDALHKLTNVDCDIEIKKHRNKRSINANNYFWKLCSELAEVLSEDGIKHTKEDVYRKIIRESGIYRDDYVSRSSVVWRRAAWRQIGTGWISECVDFSPDGNSVIVRFYYGSSVYDSKQMYRLIRSVQEDCLAVGGIEIRTPAEIRAMLEEWDEKQAHKGL